MQATDTPKELEQQVLGAILLRPESMLNLSSRLSDKMFTLEAHRQIYAEMLKLHAAGKEIRKLTVEHMLGERIDDMSTNAFLSALEHAASQSPGDTLDEDVDMLAERYVRRETRRICEDSIKASGRMDISIYETMERLSAAVETMSVERSDESITLATGINRHIDQIAAAYQGKEKTGFDTGLGFVNELTGPWIRGQYIIIGASTKTGKSALTMQCALAISQQAPVLYFSFEMKAQLIAARQLASMTRVGTQRQRRGEISEQEFERIAEAAQSLTGAQNIHIISRKHDVESMFQIARTFKKKHGDLGCLIVDHLGITGKPKGLKSTSDWELAAYASPILKDIAEELDCVCVGVSQLTKEQTPYTRNFEERIKMAIRKPHYNQLKGAIANDADHVLMPFRAEAELSKIEPAEGTDDWYKWDTTIGDYRDRADIVLALSREARWPKSVTVKWDGAATSFLDIPRDEPGFGI